MIGYETSHLEKNPYVTDQRYKSPGADREAPAAALLQGLQDLMEQPLDVKLQLIQHHAMMARLLASELLEEEVECLAGERYSRDKPHGGRFCRWGATPARSASLASAFR